jgi:hypothetical protein
MVVLLYFIVGWLAIMVVRLYRLTDCLTCLLLNGLVGWLTWLWFTVYSLKGLADMIIKVYVCWLDMTVSVYGQVGWLTWFCLRMLWLVG